MLKDLKVVDLTSNIAGPGAAAMLADYGAEVIHIEKPGLGDDCRHFFPLYNGTCVTHCWVNRGKKSVAMDLKDPKAAEIVKSMVKDADVFIESFRPGVIQRLGLSYDVLSEINPRLIYCSVSAFGQHGPFSAKAGYDIVAQAYSGLIYYTGEADGDPMKVGFSVADYMCASNTYAAVMTALYSREKTGKGMFIDVPLSRGVLNMNSAMSISLDPPGPGRHRAGNHDFNLNPFGLFKRKDGDFVAIGAINVNLWKKLCMAMGREDLANDPRYITNDLRCINRDNLTRIIEDWLDSFETADEACRVLDSFGVPNSKVYSQQDILKDRHAWECGWLRKVPLPESMKGPSEEIVLAVGIADYSGFKPEYKSAPDLGQHTEEILHDYGLSDDEIHSCIDSWNKSNKL